MKINFHKYQGTGNDFIIIDNRQDQWIPTIEQVAFLCNRRFGIGADGLMLLEDHPGVDFAMKYFNSDGRESTMCGNGGRCITAFASRFNLTGNEVRFIASDGEHRSEIIDRSVDQLMIRLKMKDVRVNDSGDDYFFIDTGSPHYILFVQDVKTLDILPRAREIRYSGRFRENGTNVDFVEILKDGLFVRSYERGVEDETLSCGTGVTASAIAADLKRPDGQKAYNVYTPGGLLKVSFTRNRNFFSEVWLEGAATYVFRGEINI